VIANKAPAVIRDRLTLFLFHLFFALLFSSMLAILSWAGLTQTDVSSYFFIAWIMLLPLAATIRFRTREIGLGRSRPHQLAYAICLSGLLVPVIVQGQNLVAALGFVAVLILRTVCLFFWLPIAGIATETKLDRTIISWTLVASLLFCAASLIVAQVNGVNLSNSERLGGDWQTVKWVNGNTIAAPAATMILLCLTSSFLAPLVRVSTICLAVYVLLLTQSRTTMLALVLVIPFYGFLASLGSARRTMAFSAWLGSFVLLFASFSSVVLSLGPVQRVIQRTERADPTTGRFDIYQTALDRFSDSPLFGSGYGAIGSRFENGYLSMMVESGFFGIVLYLAFMVIVTRRAWDMLAWKSDSRAQSMAKTVLTLSLFLCLRALGERSHAFQASDLLSNVWILLAGNLLVYRKTHLAHRSGGARVVASWANPKISSI
jgi:O-antigen ligase